MESISLDKKRDSQYGGPASRCEFFGEAPNTVIMKEII